MKPPFMEAFKEDAASMPPHLLAHFDQQVEELVYDGVMESVWRAKGARGVLAWPALLIAARLQTVFPETGEEVPFTIAHRLFVGDDGRTRMTWTRTFRFPHRERCFDATMVFDRDRDIIDDRLGTGRLQAELKAWVDDGQVHLESRRQWLHVGPARIRLPSLFCGKASVREWERDDGALGIDVTISNPLLGRVFGYRGWFRLRE